ncbi:2-oxoacid:acceptor oxidoreductase subunit alpha [bacterium]|nr:2-oxoacid:acceptor oxidoreductase subunit alpha [bacterium]
MKTTNDFILTIIGSGGDGVISAGEILLSAAASEGLFGFLLKSFGPQIRGGESSIKLRISNEEIFTQGDFVQVLLVFNWGDFPRFKTEYDLSDGAIIISDSDDKLSPLSQNLPWDEKKLVNIQIPITRLTKELTGSTFNKNIFSLGLLSAMFNLPSEGLHKAIKRKFKKKSEDVLKSNIDALEAGIKWISENNLNQNDFRFEYDSVEEPKIIMNGNDSISLGAMYQGLEFYASYPITPASEILQFLGTHLPKIGGSVIQAEDELAAINMAIGASFAGKKSMTGTSGPGISLKAEAIGLASMAEIPLVIVNVQRGGPSTGLPTKFEQSDLLQAMYVTHGDAPKAVIAATSVEDSYVCANIAFQIAEKYQLPVILLSDQFISAREVSLRPFKLNKFEVISRLKPEDNESDYKRYKITENGVSPMAIPGQKGVIYQTNGLEHTSTGMPSSDLDIHKKMSEKRDLKLQHIAKEFDFVVQKDCDGAKIGVITWGSSKGAVLEAVAKLKKEGKKVSFMAPQLISPLPIHKIQPFMDKLDRLIILEMSFGKQFYTHLKSQLKLPEDVVVYNRAGGKPFSVTEVYNTISKNYVGEAE